ncbi:MAG: restriction endonuclease [Candidatus Cloacimonetes bacterium]|nr:restriction endonuclease [Candidatus Cloacimonadota bacterium]
MALGFKQRNAIRKLAEILTNFLPASGNPMWKGHVNFGSVATKLGLSEYWHGGSKLPAIIYLLENTYERKRSCFQNLIEAVVLEGKTYRNKKNEPLLRKEIDELNKCLLALEFKFPNLWDKSFLDSLYIPEAENKETPSEQDDSTEKARRALSEIKDKFYQLTKEPNRQKAGFELEKILAKIFEVYGLSPRESFRVVGEQIDGSIEYKNEIYLIEAKWTESRINEGELLKFKGKIEGKSSFTRGIFISINGFTPESIYQIKQGKRPSFFLMDGYDISMVLEKRCDLPELLYFKLRKLCEEGDMLVHYMHENRG